MLTQSQVQKISKTLKVDKKDVSMMFGALSDEGRMYIFELLIKNEGLCVTDVSRIIGVSVPAASQQLKVMELSGLVKKVREGQMICYCVARDKEVVRKIISLVNNN
jgi:DNA-binding transcriptional ArsR family regulator